MKLKENLIYFAMMLALTVAISMLFIFPVPATNGFVTLCEVGIYTSALLFGPVGGFWIGALSGFSIDLLSGYPQWMLFSFLIHGLQGFVAGFLYHKNIPWKLPISLGLASLVMIVGYALATAFLYTWPAGVASIFGNIIQNAFGIGVTVPLITALKRISFSRLKEGHKS